MKKSIFILLIILISNLNFSQDSFITNENAEVTLTSSFEESKDLYSVVTTAINTKLSDIGSTFFKDKYIME